VLYPRGKNIGIHWTGGCVSHRPGGGGDEEEEGKGEEEEEEETYPNNINISSHIIS